MREHIATIITVKTEDNKADLGTKRLARTTFEKLRAACGLEDGGPEENHSIIS